MLLVDDHPLVRAGLTALIASTDDLVVVGEASGGEQAIGLAVECEPDVVLMDLSMPGMNGVEATRGLLALQPGDPRGGADLVPRSGPGRRGAGGGCRRLPAQGLRPAGRVVGHQVCRVRPRPARPAGGAGAAAVDGTPKVSDSLSARELEVLQLVAKGLPNKLIGRNLGITERTVKVHVGHLFRRIGVADRTSAAIWARDNLPPDPAE